MKLSAESVSFGEISKALHEGEVLVLNHRKLNALKLIADCKLCLSNKHVSSELNERIEALKMQDKSMSQYEAIEILLDYAERELKASERLEKKQDNLLLSFVAWLKGFLF